MDLSPAFIAGAVESFPDAQITFDHFHVVKLLNEAMSQVRIIGRKLFISSHHILRTVFLKVLIVRFS